MKSETKCGGSKLDKTNDNNTLRSLLYLGIDCELEVILGGIPFQIQGYFRE